MTCVCLSDVAELFFSVLQPCPLSPDRQLLHAAYRPAAIRAKGIHFAGRAVSPTVDRVSIVGELAVKSDIG